MDQWTVAGATLVNRSRDGHGWRNSHQVRGSEDPRHGSRSDEHRHEPRKRERLEGPLAKPTGVAAGDLDVVFGALLRDGAPCPNHVQGARFSRGG